MARKPKYQFKPDKKQATIFKRLYLTRLQRLQILKWVLLSAACVLMLVIQDLIMSRIHISGATTDLAVCMILLIGLYEGTENGSLFVLIASIVYLFSGSSPGPFCIGLITALTIGINLLRQNLWRRSFGSTMLCAGMGVMLYEMGVFVAGLLSGLTIFARAGVFALTGILTCITMLPMYPLVRAISKIGGDTWKE
jgi:hypothetical protein